MFMQLNFSCIQLNLLYIIYFNCYATFTICPEHYLLYDMADFGLYAIFHNLLLMTLNLVPEVVWSNQSPILDAPALYPSNVVIMFFFIYIYSGDFIYPMSHRLVRNYWEKSKSYID